MTTTLILGTIVASIPGTIVASTLGTIVVAALILGTIVARTIVGRTIVHRVAAFSRRTSVSRIQATLAGRFHTGAVATSRCLDCSFSLSGFSC